MKTMKKVLCLCLTLCMMFSVAALAVSADGTAEPTFVGRTPDASDHVIFFDNVRANPNPTWGDKIFYTSGTTDSILMTENGIETYSPADATTKYGMKFQSTVFDPCSGMWGINVMNWPFSATSDMYFSIHYKVVNATNTGVKTAADTSNNGNGNPVHMLITMDIQNDTWMTYTTKIGDALVDDSKNPTTTDKAFPAAGTYFGMALPALEGEGAYYIIDYVGIFDTAENAAAEARFWDSYYAGQPIPSSVGSDTAPGEYFEVKNVKLGSTTADVEIYYTLDGSTPDKNSTRYTDAGVDVTATATLKAVAYDPATERYSNVTSFAYTINTNIVAAPEFDSTVDFVPTGKKVALSTTTAGAKIYYTVDGTEPTSASIEYTAPIEINSTMMIKAIAVKAGMENSAVTTLEIKGLIANDIVWTFSGLIGGSANGELTEAQGVYHNAQFNAIFGGGEWGLENDADGGVVMEVHKDKEIALRIENWSYASTPWSLPNGSYRYLALTYKTPVDLEFNYHANHYQNGERSAMMTLPAAESYTSVVIDLYALNPNWAKQGGQPDFSLQFYHDDAEHTTLSVLSVGFYQTESEAQKLMVAAPNASVPVADKHLDVISVELTSATEGASIYYTLDGTEPTVATGTLYTTPIVISSDTVVKAIAVKENYYDSNVAIFDYKVTPTVATPEVSLKNGQYEGEQTVTVTCATEGATIYYTTDSSAPSATNGTVYSGPVTISNSCVFKVIAILEGKKDSKVVSRTYNIAPVADNNTNNTTPDANAPVTEVPGTTATPAEESGCASSMAAGTLILVTLISGAGVVLCKKKEN